MAEGGSAIDGSGMETSARNQLQGIVTSVSIGAVMAEVVVEVNGAQVVAAITRTRRSGSDSRPGSP